jgi:hypothetical protein
MSLVLVELLAVQARDLVQRAAMQRLALGPAGRTRVGEAIVEPLVADGRPQDGFGLEQPVPIAVDQGQGSSLRVGSRHLDDHLPFFPFDDGRPTAHRKRRVQDRSGHDPQDPLKAISGSTEPSDGS